MDSRDPTLCPEELLAQLGWVRALARSLVYDPHDADDVLQQVCLLALQKAPTEARTGARLRAWLATVTRDVVRRGARSDARRTLRELASPQPEQLPSADRLAARREALRQLIHAVTNLEEPYFSAIVERYFEGFSIHDMADLSGTTPAAIRQRLSRARARLRTRLERLLDDDGNAWLLAVLPAAPAASSAKVLAGKFSLGQIGGALMAMSKGTATLVSSILLLTVVGVVFFVSWHGPATDASGISSQVTLDAAAHQNAQAPLLPDRALPSPSTLALPSAITEAPSGGTPVPDPQQAGEPLTIHGQVVDATGRPLEGATVWYAPTATTLVAWGLLTAERVPSWTSSTGAFDPTSLPHVTTDADGRFTLQSRAVTEPLQDPDIQEGATCGLALVITFEGLATRAHGCPGFTAGEYDAGVIALTEPGAAIAGRVLQSGQPVQGVVAACLGSYVPDAATIPAANCAREMIRFFQRTATDGDGRFRISGLWAGQTSVRVQKAGIGSKGTGHLQTVAGDILDMGDIELGLRQLISGVVLDDAGRPVVGAHLYRLYFEQGLPDADRTYAALVRGHETAKYDEDERPPPTDAEGRFAMTMFPNRRITIMADAAGFEPVRVADVGVDTPPLTITLARCSTIALSVLDADTGTPLSEATVHATRQYDANPGDALWEIVGDELPVLSGDDARSALGLGPGAAAPFVIQRAGVFTTHLAVEALGYATQGITVPGMEVGTQRTAQVRLARAAVLTGRVLNEAGEGIAKAIITTRSNGDVPVPKAAERLAADGEGRFALEGLGVGTFQLTALAQGYSPSDDHTVTVTPGSPISPLEIVLAPAGGIEGVVYEANGALAPGRTVRIRGEEREGQPRNKHVLNTDTRGAFAVESLTPGTYSLTVEPDIDLRIQVESGRTTHVEARERVQATLHGRVLCGGKPVADAHVSIYQEINYSPTETDWLPEANKACGPDGSWTTSLAADRYRLVACAPSIGLGAPREVTLDWNQDLAIDLVIAGQQLSGHVLSAATETPIEGAVVWIWSEAASAEITLNTDKQGMFGGRFAPETYSLRASAPGFVAADVDGLVINGSEGPPPLTLRLQQEAVLRGSVRLASSAPAVDGTVVIVEWPGKYVSQWPQARVAGGTYRIEGLPAGDLHVMVHRVGWYEYSQPPEAPICDAHATLAAGAERVLDLVIPDAQ